jgi:tryprostatin B 6-hydroxylase
LIKYPNATAPFSLGPFNCIGRPFAITNVRLTIATIVMRYNLSFAPGATDPIADFEDGMHEHFSLQPGPLFLRMERRSEGL